MGRIIALLRKIFPVLSQAALNSKALPTAARLSLQQPQRARALNSKLHSLLALYLEMLALGALVAFYRGLPLLYKYSYSIAEARASKILTKPPRRGNFNKI